jgi:hypothetical protein
MVRPLASLLVSYETLVPRPERRCRPRSPNACPNLCRCTASRRDSEVTATARRGSPRPGARRPILVAVRWRHETTAAGSGWCTIRRLAAQSGAAAYLSRLAVRRHDPRWEPGAVVPLAGICAGGGEQSPFLPRRAFFNDLRTTRFSVDVAWRIMDRVGRPRRPRVGSRSRWVDYSTRDHPQASTGSLLSPSRPVHQ